MRTSSPTDAGPRRRILLADDVELNRDLLRGVLTGAGFEVDAVCDGAAACAATWAKTYDLVLMDVEMPGMNGFEAAARIRAREGVMSGVKIAALTATARPDAERFSFWSGIDVFIAKPVEPARLVRVVRELTDDGSVAEDWKPVWRIAAFSRIKDPATAAVVLHHVVDLLDATAAAIDHNRLDPQAYRRELRELCEMAARLGFEELAALSAVALADFARPDARCRDPNLIGAIERARYAIDEFRAERGSAAVPTEAPARPTGVAALLRGALGQRHAAIL